jgi:hypothetical protein
LSEFLSKPCTVFAGTRLFARGPLIDMALAVKTMDADAHPGTVLTFDDATGVVVDLDLRGDTAAIVSRLADRARDESSARTRRKPADADAPARGRGRPRLGVVAREVTLLPRHWDWLAAQSGGASQALRRIVDEARRNDGGKTQRRAAQEAAYRFMTTMAGDLAGFEEASRALFAGDERRFIEQTAAWPEDVGAHARILASFACGGDVAEPTGE